MNLWYRATRVFSRAHPVGAPASATHPFDAFLNEAALAPAEGALKLVRSQPDGLSQAMAELRFRRSGPNEVYQEEHASWLSQLLSTFRNPLVLLLVGLSAVSFATDNAVGGFIVASMVLLSVLLTFFQEFRSNQAAQRLKEMVTTTASVLRRHELQFGKDMIVRAEKVELPIHLLVPGDIVQLSAGDMVPADLRVLAAKDLFISQSALTGEALPLEKSPLPAPQAGPPLEAACLCFMGSNVVSGTARAVVLKTGAETYLGSVARSLAGRRELSGFEEGVNKFTWLMLRFMLVMVPLVFLINGLTKGDWLQAFLFAVSVAVGLTPEMLPMIVTVNLARGALAMSRKKVIVKRLNSIQNFGAMDILCTDKTGTLTQDKVALLKYVDPSGFKSAQVLKFGYLNSFHQTGLKNLLDLAVLERAAEEKGLPKADSYRKVDEIPFDFTRRRMSVVVQEAGGQDLLVCKGALEEVFACCDRVLAEGDVVALDGELSAGFRQVAADLNDEGMRVIVVAYKEMPPEHPAFSVADESGLILLGYMAFLDPPKESAAPAIASLQGHGVRVKVLTGDNDAVTRKVCQQVGVDVGRMLLGSEVAALDEAGLAEAVDHCDVFAKLSPAQKERIVKALKAKGHVVGFMGDGINDAPALKAADVGVSVDNAVDIAKESADIILLEKSLAVLDEGVLEGRKVFGNIIKYVRMGASSNFGNMFSVLGASFLLPFLPMLPLQLLTQNLLYDLSQTAIPFDQVDEEYLAKPRKWDISGIARFMFFLGPVSSLFDYATFAVLWFGLGARTLGQQGLFQTGWFVEGLISQTLVVHLIRTNRLPFIQSRAAWPLIVTTLLVVGVGLWLPFSFAAPHLGFVPLPGRYFGWLGAILLGYAVLAQGAKALFLRRYGQA